ncbi:RNA 2',3'-cyclic phosphodiesterase [Ralstonia sp. 121560039-2]
MTEAACRLFIALDPTPATIAVLERATAILHARSWTGARWLPPDQWHATVRFLGATPARQVPQWVSALNQIRRIGQEAPPLSVDGIAIWPAPTHPRVMVVTARSARWADEIAAGAEALAREAGYRAEMRPFHPHVTLARLGSRAVSTDALAAVQHAAKELEGEPLRFDCLSLFVSRSPQEAGPTYERLATIKLSPGAR